MDYASTDLSLAIAHHLLVFSIAGIIAYEIGAVRQGMSGQEILRIAKVDSWYGILAAAILIVGFTRANIAAKGWEYYSTNIFFWAKISAFALVGLLSIAPTITFIRWRRILKDNSAFVPTPQSITATRRFLWAEVAVFAFIPIFAAAMARG